MSNEIISNINTKLKELADFVNDIEDSACNIIWEKPLELNKIGVNVKIPENISFPDKPGIYIFEIMISEKEIISNFKNNWEEINIVSSPAINLSNVECYNNSKDKNKAVWHTLYIGKSETNIKTRIMNHIAMGDNNETTYALRLNRRSKINDYQIRLKWIALDDNDRKKMPYYKLTLHVLEYLLHEKLKPLVGSK